MSSSQIDELHNKLHLGSDDIRYLESQFLKAAHEKLDLHLPKNDNLKEDPFREKVVDMIESVCLFTFI